MAIYVMIVLSAHTIHAQMLHADSTGVFVYTSTGPLADKAINVYYHIPEGDLSTMPILMSFHGASRNADDYRDYWISLADEYKFMIFAPEFSSANFPRGDGYQLANIFDDGDHPSDSTFNDKAEWTFSILDPLFEYIKEDVSSCQQAYLGWGHSGGAQFLSRFVLYMPDSKLAMAVCSNAGWYTVPEYGVSFPYGLDNGLLPEADLRNALSKKMIIHLGQADTVQTSSGLRHNSVVDTQQGLYRLVRGRYFYATSQAMADSLQTCFHWETYEVPAIDHDAQAMANDAVQYLFPVQARYGHGAAYPMPFRDRVAIPVQVSRGASYKVAIFNSAGQQVKLYTATAAEADTSHIWWDGTNTTGVQQTHGIFYYHVTTGLGRVTGRLVKTD